MNHKRVNLPHEFSTPEIVYQTLQQGHQYHTEYKDATVFTSVERITKRCGEHTSEETN